MSKHYFYLGKDDDTLARVLAERIEEEGGQASDTIKYLLLTALGITDARVEKRHGRDEHPDTYGAFLRLTMPLWDALSAERVRRRMPMAATIRAILHEALNVPLPEKVKRAPRDPALTNALIMESQADSFNDMRNLRNTPKERELTWGEQVLAGPDAVFTVSDCFVPGCREHDCGFHKHVGRDLLLRAERYMPEEGE